MSPTLEQSARWPGRWTIRCPGSGATLPTRSDVSPASLTGPGTSPATSFSGFVSWRPTTRVPRCGLRRRGRSAVVPTESPSPRRGEEWLLHGVGTCHHVPTDPASLPARGGRQARMKSAAIRTRLDLVLPGGGRLTGAGPLFRGHGMETTTTAKPTVSERLSPGPPRRPGAGRGGGARCSGPMSAGNSGPARGIACARGAG
jgi:hypothetical protein